LVIEMEKRQLCWQRGQEEWQLERRRFFSEATMAKIPEPDEALELADGKGAEEAVGTLS
jgi:hypothetical protein